MTLRTKAKVLVTWDSQTKTVHVFWAHSCLSHAPIEKSYDVTMRIKRLTSPISPARELWNGSGRLFSSCLVAPAAGNNLTYTRKTNISIRHIYMYISYDICTYLLHLKDRGYILTVNILKRLKRRYAYSVILWLLTVIFLPQTSSPWWTDAGHRWSKLERWPWQTTDVSTASLLVPRC